ncbi:MAG: hypothetical protein V9E95_08640 [Methanothrix soehngenii]
MPASEATGIIAATTSGVVTDHAHVGQSLRGDLLQQAAHAWRVDLDAEEIVVRPRGGDGGGGLAHAAADFEDERREAAVGAGEIERRGGERQAKRRGQSSSARGWAGEMRPWRST